MSPLLPLACALLLCPSIPSQDDETPDGNKLVRVELLADREALQPGTTFTLAIKYSIEPKWHIYWENPGDAGIATRADITAPAGYEVGPLRFPPPQRDEEAGDIVQFIHERELVLLADVKVPASAAAGTRAAFRVEGRWLVCTDLCVPGKGEAALEVAIASAAKPAREKEFAAWRARLPRAWSELSKARLMWSGDEEAPVLRVLVPGATAVEFFPLRSPAMNMTKRVVEAGKQGASATIEWEFERKEPTDKPLARGVLVVKTSEGEASYRLESTFEKL